MSSLDRTLDWLSQATITDLAQPMYNGMPGFPNNPPYLFTLARPHGKGITGEGTSAAVEVLVTSGHAGTHMDALGHFSFHGRLCCGEVAKEHQSFERGLLTQGIEQAPIASRRGVLLDVPLVVGQDPLPRDYAIQARDLEAVTHLEAVEIMPEDAVLIRTGWGGHWGDPNFPVLVAPGPSGEAAEWLAGKGIRVTGSDTLSYEVLPNVGWPVHVCLLVKNRIYILEALNLETLSDRRSYEFIFWAAPMPVVGGTGSIVRPIALS